LSEDFNLTTNNDLEIVALPGRMNVRGIIQDTGTIISNSQQRSM